MHKHRGRAFVATYTAGREGWQNDQLSLQQLFLFLKIEAEYWFDESKKVCLIQLRHNFTFLVLLSVSILQCLMRGIQLVLFIVGVVRPFGCLC